MNSQNSKWLRNEACPHCRDNGGDTKGDNLARYSDGHGYCWSCRTYYPATEKRKAADHMTYNDLMKKICPDFKEEKVEGAHRDWLLKYIDGDEIDEFFFYDPLMDRHVFMHHKGEEDWWYSARSVREGYIPKTISEGTRPALCLGKYKESRTLVVVEDIVSAIKVGRQYGAMPLFGSHLPSEWIIKACKTGFIDEVIVWLDEDKVMDGRIYSRKSNLYVPTVAIWTEKDPKDYTDEEIKQEIEQAKEMLNEPETDSTGS